MKLPTDLEIRSTAATPLAGTNQSVEVLAYARSQPRRFVCSVRIEVACETKDETDGIYGTGAIETVAKQVCEALFDRHPDGNREDLPLLVMRPFLRQLPDDSFEAYVDMGLGCSQAPTNHPTEKAGRDMLKLIMGNHHNQGYVIEVAGKRYAVSSHNDAAWSVPVAVQGAR